MALQDSGSIPPIVSMSAFDINEEIGELGNKRFDFYGAASSFSGILPGSVELLEFYNKTFAGGIGDYGSIQAHTFRFLDDAGGNDQGWEDGYLVLAAENADYQTFAVNSKTAYVDDFIAGDLTNGDVAYENLAGTTLTTLRPGQQLNDAIDPTFLLDLTSHKIFSIDSDAVISNVTSRTPASASTPTGTSPSSTQINLTISNSNTIVTRIYQISRSLSAGGTYSGIGTTLPTASGSISNTSVTTTYNDTGLSAGTTYYYKVRGVNDYNTTLSDASAGITTQAAGTSWSVPADFSLTMLSSDTANGPDEISAPLTATLTNGSGTTDISCQQPTDSTLEVAVSTIGDPGTSGTANSGTGFSTSHTGLSLNGTYYLRFSLQENGVNRDQASQSRTITFTNNSVSNTDLQITVQITNSGGPPP